MISDRERGCLQHALGLDRNRNPFRNHFFAEPGSPDDEVFAAMAKRGLARLTTKPPAGQLAANMWRVTEAGARAVGTTAEQARRIAS